MITKIKKIFKTTLMNMIPIASLTNLCLWRLKVKSQDNANFNILTTEGICTLYKDKLPIELLIRLIDVCDCSVCQQPRNSECGLVLSTPGSITFFVCSFCLSNLANDVVNRDRVKDRWLTNAISSFDDTMLDKRKRKRAKIVATDWLWNKRFLVFLDSCFSFYLSCVNSQKKVTISYL